MRQLIFLGTGAAMATECYNACFLLRTPDDEYFLTDAGGGYGILRQMKRAEIPFERLRCMFVTHGHSDHIMGTVWVIRRIASLMNKDFYGGEFHIYCHDVACEIIEMMAQMLSSVRDALCCRDDIVLVTMAAGLKIDTIREMAGGNYKVIRIMPNTPVEVGEGEILYIPAENVTDGELEEFLTLMQHAGQLTAIPESLMDAGCSLSGCGPAFVFKFIRALAQGGIDAGIDGETALALAAQTVIGAAKLLTDSPLDPDTLIKNVCSPGGSTIEGVKSLDEDDFEPIVAKAIAASFKRNVELGKA